MRFASGILGIAAVMAAVAVGGGFLGYRAGVASAMHAIVGISSPGDRVIPLMRYAVGADGFHGLYGQDLWVLNTVFPGVKNGFFLDIGSADGTEISNTKRLETEGWSGICVDPFPRNMADRTCAVYSQAVAGESGRAIKFHGPGTYGGGIVDFAGWWVGKDEKSKAVEMTTATIADILQRAGAPQFIHYMNVDIEGAEYDALQAFPFDRYTVGSLTIEHNNLEERRIQLRNLFESNGYRIEWALRDQDWYVHDQARDAARTAGR